MKKVVIAGCGFAGFAAAIELKNLLEDECDIEVISQQPLYVYSPALPEIPFEMREPGDISFDVRPVLAERGIGFRNERIVRIDSENDAVETPHGRYPYDYLLVALGPAAERMRPWGLDAARTSWSVISLADALEAREAWQRFVLAPGPMVVGAADGAPLYAAHYHFVLNAIQDLTARGIRDSVDIRFITPERKLGHFGAGGVVDSSLLAERVFAHHGIEWRTDAHLFEVRDDRVVLDGGEEIPTAYTMLMPRFIGSDAVRASKGVGDLLGLIEVDETCRHPKFRKIFAAGLATTFKWENSTVVSGGLPMTIYPAERMALTAASNIATCIHGGQMSEISFHELTQRCAHDASQMLERAITGGLPERRSHEVLKAGAVAQQARSRFERVLLEARSRGEIR
jgi:sulfide:quinone oxidoreductase